jgi:hypothetical protein
VAAAALLLGWSIAWAAAPASGRVAGLLDVGSQRLYVACDGAGAPPIVLESELQRISDEWTVVQSSLVSVTRTCSYDRGRTRAQRSGGLAVGR